MTREDFIHLFTTTFGDHSENFLDDLNNSNSTLNYDLINHNDQCYIINTDTLEIIGWYKTYHIGRCLQTNLKSDIEIINFIKQLYKDYLDSVLDIW